MGEKKIRKSYEEIKKAITFAAAFEVSRVKKVELEAVSTLKQRVKKIYESGGYRKR